MKKNKIEMLKFRYKYYSDKILMKEYSKKIAVIDEMDFKSFDLDKIQEMTSYCDYKIKMSGEKNVTERYVSFTSLLFSILIVLVTLNSNFNASMTEDIDKLHKVMEKNGVVYTEVLSGVSKLESFEKYVENKVDYKIEIQRLSDNIQLYDLSRVNNQDLIRDIFSQVNEMYKIAIDEKHSEEYLSTLYEINDDLISVQNELLEPNNEGRLRNYYLNIIPLILMAVVLLVRYMEIGIKQRIDILNIELLNRQIELLKVAEAFKNSINKSIIS